MDWRYIKKLRAYTHHSWRLLCCIHTTATLGRPYDNLYRSWSVPDGVCVCTTALLNDSRFWKSRKRITVKEGESTRQLFYFLGIRNSKKVALYPVNIRRERKGLLPPLRNVHVAPLVGPRLFSHSLSSSEHSAQLAVVCCAWWTSPVAARCGTAFALSPAPSSRIT